MSTENYEGPLRIGCGIHTDDDNNGDNRVGDNTADEEEEEGHYSQIVFGVFLKL